MIIDTHSHLYYPELKSKLKEIIDRAKSNGVVKIIIPAVNVETSREVISIAEKYSEIYVALGIHPTEVKNSKTKDIEKINDLLGHEKVVAVGEIGLDYYWDKDNIDNQKYYFSEQIKIAIEKELPVIIHTRNSIEDTIRIIEEISSPKLKGQFHCFSGNFENLQKILNFKNFFISFCGNITYKNNKSATLIKNIPPEKLLFETDSPFMTPSPIKDKINEPANIVYTISKISELIGVNYNELINIVSNNTYKLFSKLKEEN
ncbi:MAG: TatD family hydrolase [Ignavibacteria bacterium]|nr:TatD family hydrolase [Ignavibacteria bacterium]